MLGAKSGEGVPDLKSQRALVEMLMKSGRPYEALAILVEMGEAGFAIYADPWALLFRRALLPSFAKKSRVWTEVLAALRELEPYVSEGS